MGAEVVVEAAGCGWREKVEEEENGGGGVLFDNTWNGGVGDETDEADSDVADADDDSDADADSDADSDADAEFPKSPARRRVAIGNPAYFGSHTRQSRNNKAREKRKSNEREPDCCTRSCRARAITLTSCIEQSDNSTLNTKSER